MNQQQMRMQQNARMQQQAMATSGKNLQDAAYEQPAQTQLSGMHPSMLHALSLQQNAQMREGSYGVSQHVSKAYEDTKNSGKDINSKVDDLMNS